MSSQLKRRVLRIGSAWVLGWSTLCFAQSDTSHLTPEQIESKMRALHPTPVSLEEKLRMDGQLPPADKSTSDEEWSTPVVGVAPPANDNCEFPIIVGLGTVLPFDNTCATAQPSDPSFPCGGGGAPFNSLWYRFTPAVSGSYQIDLCGSTFDTLLGIWTGNVCGPYMNVACNDDFCGLQSQINVSLTAGVTYRIEIDGFSGSIGSGTLHISSPNQPVNDACSTATILPGAGPFPVTGNLNTLFAATDPTDPLQACTFGGPAQNSNSVWYQWTPASSCAASFDTCTSAYDTVVSVFTGSCAAIGNEIACNDDGGSPSCSGTLQSGVTWIASAGTTYLIEVTDYSGPGGGNLNYRLDCSSGLLNDNCSSATALPSAGPFPIVCMQSTAAATQEPSDPLQACTFGGPNANGFSVWYSWSAAQSSRMALNTCGSDYDTVVSVFTGSCGALNEIACNDDSGSAGPCAGTLQSFLTFDASAGVTYTIEISSFAFSPGGNLRKSLGPLAPDDVEPNNTVASANPGGCGQNRVGLLSPRDLDVDYWSFTLAEWSLVTISVDVPDILSSVNPFLLIVDPMGNAIRVNDDFVGINSQIIMNLPPGTWYAAVRSSTTASDPDPRPDRDLYAIHFLGCDPIPCDPDPTCTNDGGESDGSITVTRGMDCLYFPTCGPNTRAEISVDSTTIDPCVFLTDAMDNYIDFDDDDGDGVNSNLCATLPTPGLYRIRVQNFGDGTGAFTVRLRFVPVATGTESEPNNTIATADPIPVGGPIAGLLDGPGDVDYYSFTVPGMQRRGITVIARSCAGHDNFPQIATDLALRLYGDGGVLLGTANRNNGPDADEMAKGQIPPGSYTLAVFTTAPVDPQGGRYELTVSVCNVAATLTSKGSTCQCCDRPLSFRVDLENLLNRPVVADLFLQIRFCGGATCSLSPPRSFPLGARQRLSVCVPRAGFPNDPTTMQQWLAAMRCNCPVSTTAIEFILTISSEGIPEGSSSCTYLISPPCPP